MPDKKPTIKITPINEFLKVGSDSNKNGYKKKRLERREKVREIVDKLKLPPPFVPKYTGQVPPKVRTLPERPEGELSTEITKYLPVGETPLRTDQSPSLPNVKNLLYNEEEPSYQEQIMETVKTPGKLLSKGVSQLKKGYFAPGLFNIVNSVGTAALTPLSVGDVAMKRVGGIPEWLYKGAMFPFAVSEEVRQQVRKIGDVVDKYSDLPKMSPEMVESLDVFGSIVYPLVLGGTTHGIMRNRGPALPKDYLLPTLETGKGGKLYHPYKPTYAEKTGFQNMYKETPEEGGPIPQPESSYYKKRTKISQRGPTIPEVKTKPFTTSKSPDIPRPTIKVPEFPEVQETAQRTAGKKKLVGIKEQNIDITKEGPFYSKLEDTIEKKMSPSMTSESLRGLLKNEGIPTDEIKWSKIEDLLTSKDKVTKEEVTSYIKENYPQIEHKTNLEREYVKYTEEGGENYQEHLFKWKNPPEGTKFKGSHWEDKNILFHTRTKDRIVNNKKYLDVEEFQSDWSQEGRSVGFYKGKIEKLPEGYEHVSRVDSRGGAIYEVVDKHGEIIGRSDVNKFKAEENALEILNRRPKENPIADTWEDLAVKQMIQYAIENNYDGIRWTSADIQSKRWVGEARSRINSIKWNVSNEHKKQNSIAIYLNNDEGRNINFSTLDDWVGHDMAERIRNDVISGKDKGEISGLDIKIGGEIYDYIYNKRVPQFVKDYLKITPEKKNDWWTVDLTPEVKQKLSKGQPIYGKGIKQQALGVESYETKLRPAVEYQGKVYEDDIHAKAIDSIWREDPDALIKDMNFGFLDDKGKFKSRSDLTSEMKSRFMEMEETPKEFINAEDFKESHPSAYNFINEFEGDLTKLTPRDLRGFLMMVWDERPKSRRDFVKHSQKIIEIEDLAEKFGKKYVEDTKNEILNGLKAGLEKGDLTEDQYAIMRELTKDLKNPTFQLKTGKEGEVSTYGIKNNMIFITDPGAYPHELGHFGFYNILTKEERASYLEFVKDNLYDEKGVLDYAKMRERTAFAPGSLTPTGILKSNVLDDFSEYFAEQFAQYVYSKKVSFPQMKSLYQKVIDWARSFFIKLKDKDLVHKELEDSFNKIISDKPIEIKPDIIEKSGITTKGKELTEMISGEKSKELRLSIQPLKNNKTIQNIKEAGKFIKDSMTRVFQATYPVEKKYGKEVPSKVLRTIHTPDADLITFDFEKSSVYDAKFQTLQKWFGNFADKDLDNFNATRGTPKSPEGQQIKADALNKLNPNLKDPDLMDSLKDMSDYIYDFANKNDIKLDYLEDYFYGSYKDPGIVKKFMDYWKTTTRYTKHKEIPTPADAMAFGLELKDKNPVTNLKREYVSISRRVGFNNHKKELLQSQAPYAVLKNKAAKGQLRNWEKIHDPVFEDMLFDPDYAKLFNNLISTNKVSQNVFLKGIRQLSYLTQQVKFFGSIFHFINTMKSAVAMENGALANPSGYVDVMKSFKAINRNTPEYKDYVNLGGEHKYSLEYQAINQVTNFLNKLSKGDGWHKYLKFPSKYIIENKYVPITPGFIQWMFDEYIPAVKFTKFQKDIVKKSEKLGRPMTDGEKIDVIKKVQNFYGEMNERLFGRSATATSVLRLIFMAPGYGEGNFRAIFKTPVDRDYAKFVVNSLVTTAVISSVGTKILTGEWPEVPTSWEDRDKIRDIFKVRTGEKDEKGDEIYFDMLTYDKDFWDTYGELALGKPGKVLEGFGKRIGGMVSVPFRILTDLSTLIKGDMVYDYKGEPLWRKSNNYGEKINKYLKRLGEITEPISYSIFKKAFEDDLWKSFATSYFGLRTTKSEETKKTKESLSMLYDLSKSRDSKKYELGRLMTDDPETAEKEREGFNESQTKKLKRIFGEENFNNLKESELNRFIIEELKEKEIKTEGTHIEEFFENKKRKKSKAY